MSSRSAGITLVCSGELPSSSVDLKRTEEALLLFSAEAVSATVVADSAEVVFSGIGDFDLGRRDGLGGTTGGFGADVSGGDEACEREGLGGTAGGGDDIFCKRKRKKKKDLFFDQPVGCYYLCRKKIDKNAVRR